MGDAEDRPGVSQQGVNLLREPARVPELEDGLDPRPRRIPAEPIHEAGQPLWIGPKARRELKQNRAEPLPQRPGIRDEFGPRRFNPFKLLNVGDEAAGLDGENKVLRDGRGPFPVRLDFGQVIKRIVHLHRIEMPGVKGQPVRGRLDALRIKYPVPLPVGPPGGADMQMTLHDS